MRHLDLFSGIGGFAYAVDQVWPDAEHIFCDNDKFCQQVLKKHWPNSKIYNDIREITTDTRSKKQRGIPSGEREEVSPFGEIFLLTGGFPCQPFSQAGKRRGTKDDRHLWPEMLRVIRLTKPQWVIAENVRGLLTQESGMVFEQVCLDLEASSYEVQPFIIPAVAVNAPHRRDRVWFVARSNANDSEGRGRDIRFGKHERKTTGEVNAPRRADKDATDTTKQGGELRKRGKGNNTRNEKGLFGCEDSAVKNPISERSGGWLESNGQILECQVSKAKNERPSWEKNWLEVATELCGMDDGLSPELDFTGWTKARHRVERLKSLGNSIVPQVAIEIMKAINSKLISNLF